MTFAIETRGFTKSFGDVLSVDSLDLKVPQGEIYGFLGLNGAGKTTTIRALLGMIIPTAGEVSVLGQRIVSDKVGPWDRVGHLVETAAAYPDLTVRENLDIARRLQGLDDRTRVDQVIEQLHLENYAERKAGVLSLGNFQRLGLARTLLHQPEVLLLDEPANGLDPAGVVEIRQLLERLAEDEGVTIFMSSHILTEVDRLATRIGIIHDGRLIEELDAGQLAALRRRRLAVRTRDPERALQLLQSAGHTVSREEDTLYLDGEVETAQPERINSYLVKNGQPPVHLALEQEDLEHHFLHLTGGEK